MIIVKLLMSKSPRFFEKRGKMHPLLFTVSPGLDALNRRFLLLLLRGFRLSLCQFLWEWRFFDWYAGL